MFEAIIANFSTFYRLRAFLQGFLQRPKSSKLLVFRQKCRKSSKIRSPGHSKNLCKNCYRLFQMLKFAVKASNIFQIKEKQQRTKNYHPLLVCKNQFLILLVSYVVVCCKTFPHHCMYVTKYFRCVGNYKQNCWIQIKLVFRYTCVLRKRM